MRAPVLAVAAAIALAGCSNPSGTSTTTPTTPSAPATAAPSASSVADPAATTALAQATAALGTTSFRATVTAGTGFNLVAAIDAPSSKGSAELTATGTNTQLTVKSLLLGQDLYAQIPGVTKENTWTHLDITRLPEGANVGLRPGQIDPVNTADLLGSTTDVRSTGSRSYAGTLDLTKAAGVAGIDKVTIDGYGPEAQHVPFTAGLDEQGRLSVLTIQPPAVQGKPIVPIEALYTGYGDPVTAAQPPAAQVVEAPAEVYQALGGA
ncbi:hypothetical protein [Actinoplanes derwentensis]|uniref:Lipoprotein LprG n=1 Tax=Actinoplanes derwentensis TaxID=113562 RepID=A0A1H2D2S6_9ACTN|nr:hypothetical protein [Actinoplanes derwentensis]GID88275.1 hypothetical protein Ade03nite_71990 [Actinoplanes derwentensis]SDT77060.1 hypothetical protein SAMN04489716_7817 [Actinoplanes derwentensis]